MSPPDFAKFTIFTTSPNSPVGMTIESLALSVDLRMARRLLLNPLTTGLARQ